MSWNNVLPAAVWECQSTCKEREPGTGFVIHVEGCPIGKQLAERKAQEPKVPDDVQ